MIRRPVLREISLESVLPPRQGEAIITMSAGQWDRLLESAYAEGFILLELDRNERPVRAYKREELKQ